MVHASLDVPIPRTSASQFSRFVIVKSIVTTDKMNKNAVGSIISNNNETTSRFWGLPRWSVASAFPPRRFLNLISGSQRRT